MSMRALVGLTVVLLLAACGDQPAPSTTTTPKATATGMEAKGEPAPRAESPPDVAVTGGTQTLNLRPWSYCWGRVCADGAPPDPLDDAGSAAELVVEFPEPGMTFEAAFKRAGDECARTQSAELEPLSETSYRLTPLGPAGTYDVDVFGRGSDGSVIVSFQWTTTDDGPLAQPTAQVSVLAGHDGEIDSYGVELGVVNLPTTPVKASAQITVTAADGKQLTIEPKLDTPADGCADEGTLSWQASEAKGKQAADLGDPPFTYSVELVLDGATYIGTATWPADEDPECAPCTPLRFEPPLPALTG